MGASIPRGDSAPDCSKTNYLGCAEGPHPVGSHPEGASPYGVLDMAGNVEEWVADWYDRDYYGRSPDRNPQGPDTGDLRVVRGGTFHCNQYVVRSACRYKLIPDYWTKYAGFRVALSPGDL